MLFDSGLSPTLVEREVSTEFALQRSHRKVTRARQLLDFARSGRKRRCAKIPFHPTSPQFASLLRLLLDHYDGPAQRESEPVDPIICAVVAALQFSARA